MQERELTLLRLTISVGCLMLIIWRLAGIFGDAVFVDFLAYYDVTRAIALGVNPYDLKNLTAYDWAEAPIVYPGYVTMFWLLTQLPIKTASQVFLLINVILCGWLMAAVFFRTGLMTRRSWLRPDRAQVLFMVSCACLFFSSPCMAALRHGQSSIIIAACLLWVVWPGRAWSGGLVLALAAVLKYTMLPLLVLALLVKRRWLACLISLVIFVLLSLAPLLFGHNPVQLYTSYVQELTKQTGTGFNTFAVSGYNMVTLDFLQSKTAATAVKILFLLIAVWAIWHERKDRGFGLNFLLLLCCVSMLVVYNRLYNMVFIEVLLLVKINLCLMRGNYWSVPVPSCFILVLLMPLSMVLRSANELGEIAMDNSMVHLSSYGDMTTIFPTLSLLMLAITLYAAAEYTSRRDDYHFAAELPSTEDKKDETV